MPKYTTPSMGLMDAHASLDGSIHATKGGTNKYDKNCLNMEFTCANQNSKNGLRISGGVDCWFCPIICLWLIVFTRNDDWNFINLLEYKGKRNAFCWFPLFGHWSFTTVNRFKGSDCPLDIWSPNGIYQLSTSMSNNFELPLQVIEAWMIHLNTISIQFPESRVKVWAQAFPKSRPDTWNVRYTSQSLMENLVSVLPHFRDMNMIDFILPGLSIIASW